jgi:hypothetical protein
MSFALALVAVLGFGGLLIESASAQNSNTHPTMSGRMGQGHGRRRHRRHQKHRRHRRHNMKHMNGNANN